MKKRTLLIVISGIVLLIVAAFIYVGSLPKTTPDNKVKDEKQTETTAPPTSTDPNTQTPIPATGKYVDYSEASFAAAVNNKRILFFHASWCPQCRALEKSIQEGQVPAGMVILKVDYDSSQSLRQKYGVTLQTTLVEVDKNGALQKKYVAYDEPSLATITREFSQ